MEGGRQRQRETSNMKVFTVHMLLPAERTLVKAVMGPLGAIHHPLSTISQCGGHMMVNSAL